ncbi:MAG: VWA domain-containing protein, partial [Pyrinomonadaceae bacterium]
KLLPDKAGIELRNVMMLPSAVFSSCSVPTTVSDRNGRYIPNLTAADFQIFQDGVQQNIEFFAATEEPITVALLIDTSQSTRPVLGDIKDSAKSFIKLLTPADRAMIVSFDFAAHTLSPLTNDQEKLKNAIKSAEIPKQLAGTTLRDAIYDTINTAFKGLTGRKAIILLTDGKDFGSRISRDTLLFRLEESDTLVYTVFFKTDDRPQRPMFGRRRGGIFGRGFPPFGWPDRRDNRQRERMEQENRIAEAFLQQLSDLTAGRLYSSKDGKLKKTFAAIVDELRFQYRLGFYPEEKPGDAGLHTLRVKVSRPDVSVRSRGSYRTQSK